MVGPSLGVLAVLTALTSQALGQASWEANQVNTRICHWQQLRASVVRDTVYLDGGALYWQPGFADGSFGRAFDDGNPKGIIYTLNFSTPFNTTENITAVLGTLPKVGDGVDATNRAPTYIDGALLGNNEEFFLYGGLAARTDAYSEPSGTTALSYQRYQYGPVRSDFKPQFVDRDLGVNMTRYIAYGGAASAPSENLAWYFSGLRSASGGPVYAVGTSNASMQAVNVSNTLITLDMTTQQRETFTNATLDLDIKGRANPELVWVPVGPRGILVALGGVVYPDFITISGSSSNKSASEAQSPSFMSTIDIYDVDGKKWYRQKTVDGPGQLTRGCAVVAPAQDGSSFNIYYYGGYDGLHQKEPFSDDVWVLSLPSFTWVKLAQSNEEGRAGHKCVMPYPDQMLVIGGYQNLGGAGSECLGETIRVFNLSTGTWVDRYDPAVHSKYTVPDPVLDKIGGTGTGGATATTPEPSGWDDDDLADVFASPYPTSKITTYYPYASVAPVDNTNPTAPSTPVPEEGGGGGVPSYLPPVLGSVLGIVFITVVAVLILLWRRRRLLRGPMSEAGTEDTNGRRVASWLRGQPSEVKAPPTVVSSDYSPLSATDVESVVAAPAPRTIAEMMNTEVQPPVELPDTSPRAELHDNNAASHRGSLNSGTIYSAGGTQQIDHASISTPTPPPQPQFYAGPLPSPPPIPDDESPIVYRPDSDALGNAPMPSSSTTSPTSATTASPRENKVLSGISNLSERDRSHLRQISDTTVSSMTTAPGMGERVLSSGNGGAVQQRDGSVESPVVVPPAAGGPAREGVDHLLAPTAAASQGAVPGSPLRRSVFREEDMNDGAGNGGNRA